MEEAIGLAISAEELVRIRRVRAGGDAENLDFKSMGEAYEAIWPRVSLELYRIGEAFHNSRGNSRLAEECKNLAEQLEKRIG